MTLPLKKLISNTLITNTLTPNNLTNKLITDNITIQKSAKNPKTISPYLFLTISMIISNIFITTNAQASSTNNGDFTQCEQHLFDKQPPIQTTTDNYTITDQKDTFSLCFNGFAVRYSVTTRNPMWSAEYLTRERLNKAKEIERKNRFHEEKQIPSNMRADVDDYKKSGYDRGHLAPSADMATAEQQYDSFSLANMVPQAPHLNRAVWREIESDTRRYVKKYQQAYVVTGAIYENTDKPVKLNNSVTIPTHIYKGVYLPDIEYAGVYFAPNDESGRIEILSLEEFSQQTGITVFPNLANKIQNEEIKLLAEDTLPKNTINVDNKDDSNSALENIEENTIETDDKEKTDWTWLLEIILSLFIWIMEQLKT